MDFFGLLPDGWTVTHPMRRQDAQGWTMLAVRKPRQRGDAIVRVEASGTDPAAAVRALVQEFRDQGYARPHRVTRGNITRRAGNRPSGV